MANFLILSKSFDLSDKTIDNNLKIADLNDCIVESQTHKDVIFCNSNFYNADTLFGEFFLNYYNNSWENFKLIYPWINQTQYQALQNFPNFFRESPNNSNDLIQLNRNTGGNNDCAWIGFFIVIDEPLVHNKISYYEFHFNLASNFNRAQRIAYKDYFNKFYKPTLKRSLNQINIDITQNNTHRLFERIDSPVRDPDGNILHGEKIQMHFRDSGSSALNIDGTWKHGGFDLPNQVCEILIEWGFILPENL